MLAFLLSNSHRNFLIFHHTILRNFRQELSPMYGEHGPDSTGFFGRDPPSTHRDNGFDVRIHPFFLKLWPLDTRNRILRW